MSSANALLLFSALFITLANANGGIDASVDRNGSSTGPVTGPGLIIFVVVFGICKSFLRSYLLSKKTDEYIFDSCPRDGQYLDLGHCPKIQS